MSDTIQLLSYPQRTILIEASGYSGTTNMPLNTLRKTIYKGTDNVLGFEVKNQDRKPVSLLGKAVMINIMQIRTGKLLVQRRAELVKAENGIFEIVIFANDLIDLDPGIYQMSAVLFSKDGLAQALYTSSNRSAALEIELVDGAYPMFTPSTLVRFTPVSNYFVSQPIPSNILRNDSSVNHTIQVVTTNFKGEFSVRGTLDYTASSINYSPIAFDQNGSSVITFDGVNHVQGFNFNGSFRWIIAQYTPAANNTGTVDKVLYRS